MRFRTILISGISVSLTVGLAIAFVNSTAAQAPKGYSRDIRGEYTGRDDPELIRDLRERRLRQMMADHPAPERMALDSLSAAAEKAVTEADAAESDYQKAIETNRMKSGTVSDAEVERLHRVFSDSRLSAMSQQIRSLRAEVEILRHQLEHPSVKIHPVSATRLNSAGQP